MACCQTFSEITEESTHVSLVPRRPKQLPKVLPVESLLHPSDRFKWSEQFNRIGQHLDHARRVHSGEQLNFPMRAGSHNIALRAGWNRNHLYHHVLSAHVRGEHELLAALAQGC